MAKSSDAFLTVPRQNFAKRPPTERLGDWREFYQEHAQEEQSRQASRCMECGVPFCHGYGCPLGNQIPEWNELVCQGRWDQAVELLHATNNFPEITGRVCPALCEASCTLGLVGEAVTVRQNEYSIVEHGWRQGWIKPYPPAQESGKKVAVVGSGPAGLAAAQQLRRLGHQVVVFEKAARPGGILRYGIPDFKLEKWVLDRRLAQMEAEGVEFETQVAVGRDISAEYLRKRFDAICLCLGAGRARDLNIPGRELAGVHLAMEYLVQQNQILAGETPEAAPINAQGKRVVIIGGGDTGADCLGTALRQGAASVHQLEILPKPPAQRDTATPWPLWPNMLRTSPAHDEGGERRWCVATTEFTGADGQVTGLQAHEVEWREPDAQGRRQMSKVEGSDFTMAADLVLLAMGFVGPDANGLLDGLGAQLDARGNLAVDDDLMTNVPGVFAAGDAQTGAWLVVRAIAGGRRMAQSVDAYLSEA